MTEEVTPETTSEETPAGLDTGPTEEPETEPAVEPAPEVPSVEVAGRSPEDAAAYIAYLESLAEEQATELRKTKETSHEPTSPEEPTDFFTDPRTAIREELDAMFRPFRDDLASRKRDVARDTLRAEFGNEWDQLEPTVNTLVAQAGLKAEGPEAEGILRTFFYTAKGLLAHRGAAPAPTTTPPALESTPVTQPPAPPQNRPSSAPLAAPASPKKKVELTENERRMAREQGMTPEQFVHARDNVSVEEVIGMVLPGEEGS